MADRVKLFDLKKEAEYFVKKEADDLPVIIEGTKAKRENEMLRRRLFRRSWVKAAHKKR